MLNSPSKRKPVHPTLYYQMETLEQDKANGLVFTSMSTLIFNFLFLFLFFSFKRCSDEEGRIQLLTSFHIRLCMSRRKCC